ncbi:hypothetical protein MG296_10690 [Flavobacteriaceae bacterium TK19130]|nr:hypothetical protein [Thermobacterium salinum]
MEKISLKKLDRKDFEVLANASKNYAEVLDHLIQVQNTAQQHIHFNIIQLFQYDVYKKVTSRSFGSKSKVSMELHTAFLLHDALQFYCSSTTDDYERSRGTSLIYKLHPMLPSVSDEGEKSVLSQIYVEED